MWGERSAASCTLCGCKAAQPGQPNLGPMLQASARGGSEELSVHRLCALWSPEVFQTEAGTLRKVLAAVRRGRQVRCVRCRRRGATLGCRVDRCPCSYHLACAAEAGCTFYCSDYIVACPDHAPQFPQKPEDVGVTPFVQGRASGGGSGQPTPGWTPGGGLLSPNAGVVSPPTALPVPKQQGRKRGRHGAMEVYEHMMAARAALKRARREIRATRRRGGDEESSDDEEHFAKKEAARLARDKARLQPITLGGRAAAVAGTGGAGAAESSGTQAGVVPQEVEGTDFSSVAGLDPVVQLLREMVLLPLMYPALFAGMGIAPPRGILFHGEPGTGKTLAARALAGACARHSPTPVTFFARKGADCLGKFSGEAERTLRLLFEEASARAPAIIFLDELDALVPARAARAGGSDQIYASVVSTLLSLMDGVSDRGNVIVIGATNRPDSIDPALRRPGRFDREVYFGLPGPEQRAEILGVHTCRWPHPPPPQFLQRVASLTEGYAGADLRALCTAAVMGAVRRAAPALIEQAEKGAATGAGACTDGAPGKGPAMPSAVAAAPPSAAFGGSAAVPEEGRGPAEPWQQLAAAVPTPQQQQEQEQQEGRRLLQPLGGLRQVLEAVQVEPRDWWEALAAAPAPCSRRHGLAALSTGAARPLAPHQLPLLAPSVRAALRAIHSSALPLLPAAAAAGAAAATLTADGAGGQDAGPRDPTTASGFAALLAHLGAAVPAAGFSAGAEEASERGAALLSQPQSAVVGEGEGQRPASEHQQPLEQGAGGRLRSGCWAPCRVLLAGEGELGQEAAAGAVLKLMEGCPLHTLSLPTAIVEGGGDATAGVVAVVGNALRRAGPHLPCVLYLPRLEAWALARTTVPAEELAVEGEGGAALEAGRAGNGADELAPAVRLAGSSPAFTGHGTPRRGAAARFPTAPSPFSGLLPLEERTPATPSAAHALRAEADALQRHTNCASPRPQHGEPFGAHHPPGSTPGHALPLSRRAQKAGAVAAQQAAGKGAAGGAVAQGAAWELGSALPRIRTSVSPEAPAPGPNRRQEQEVENEDEGSTEVEVTLLAEPWNVFVSLIKHTPPSQPVLVLATCHEPLDSLPPLLLSFFGGLSAVAAAGEASAVAALRAAEGIGGGGGGVVPVAAPTECEWRDSLASAGAAAAECIAAHAAAALQAKLAPGPELGAGAEPAAQQQQLQQQKKGEQRDGYRHACQLAEGALPSSTQQLTPTPPAPATAAGEPAAPAPPAAAQPGPLTAASAAAAATTTVPLPLGLSRAELDLGLQLLGKVSCFLRSLGARLCSDPRCHLASVWVHPGRQGRAGGSGGGSQQQEQQQRPRHGRREEEGSSQLVSLADVARRAELGGYPTLDDLLLDANRTTRAIMGATQPERHSPATAACCAVLDEIESRCHMLCQQLSLREAGPAALLRAAAAHVAAVQQELHARQLRTQAQLQRQEEEEEGAVMLQWQRDGEAACGAMQLQEPGQEQAERAVVATGVGPLREELAHERPEQAGQAGEQQGSGGQGAGVAMEEESPAAVAAAATASPATACPERPVVGGPTQAADGGGSQWSQPGSSALSEAPKSAAAAAAAAAAGLRAALQLALPEALAVALGRRARLGPSALASLEEALSSLVASGCAACAAEVELAQLGCQSSPGEQEMQQLASQCTAAVLAGAAS